MGVSSLIDSQSYTQAYRAVPRRKKSFQSAQLRIRILSDKDFDKNGERKIGEQLSLSKTWVDAHTLCHRDRCGFVSGCCSAIRSGLVSHGDRVAQLEAYQREAADGLEQGDPSRGYAEGRSSDGSEA